MLAASITALIIQAAGTTETSVNYYQIIRRNDPEDSHLNGFRFLSTGNHDRLLRIKYGKWVTGNTGILHQLSHCQFSIKRFTSRFLSGCTALMQIC
jgi:hypothetical protein